MVSYHFRKVRFRENPTLRYKQALNCLEIRDKTHLPASLSLSFCQTGSFTFPFEIFGGVLRFTDGVLRFTDCVLRFTGGALRFTGGTFATEGTGLVRKEGINKRSAESLDTQATRGADIG